jgi:hypothetical protein
MNLISINANIKDYTSYLTLQTSHGIFHCEVKNINNWYTTIEMTDESLSGLRNFLNQIII